jgi:hypothetical protein
MKLSLIEMLGASFEISRFCKLFSTHIIFMNDGRAQLQKGKATPHWKTCISHNKIPMAHAG